MTQKILIIDDDPALLSIIEMNLEAAAYKSFIAHNGEEGLRTFFAI